MTNRDGVPGTFPPGSCDCHVHIYGPLDQFPPDETFSGIGSRFAPTREYPIELLLQTWKDIGISRGVIAHLGDQESDNAVTLDALRRYPDTLRGIATIKRDISDRRLDELDEAGFKGVRINMLRQDGRPVFSMGMNYEDLKSLAPRIAERGWHAQLWIETGDLKEMAPELERLPLDFVIDHQGRTMADKTVGYEGFRWFCDRLKSGRYWCKLSGADRNTREGSPYTDTEDFMRALVSANPNRLVWATDWPHLGHPGDSLPSEIMLIDLFKRCVPDIDTRRRILVDNPVRLYGFEGF